MRKLLFLWLSFVLIPRLFDQNVSVKTNILYNAAHYPEKADQSVAAVYSKGIYTTLTGNFIKKQFNFQQNSRHNARRAKSFINLAQANKFFNQK